MTEIRTARTMRTRIQVALRYVAMAVFPLLALSGCAGGPSGIPSSGGIVVASNVNPNPEGRPSPIVLRVYELRQTGGFTSADFFSLYRNAGKVLGQNLLGTQEFELQPGQSISFTRKLPPGTRFVGVVAAFRNLDSANWRGVAALPKKKTGWLAHADVLRSSKVVVHIRLERLAVSVSVGRH